MLMPQFAGTRLTLLCVAMACLSGAASTPGTLWAGETNRELQRVGGLFEFANYQPGGKQTAAGVDNPNVRGGTVWVKWIDVELEENKYDWSVVDRLAGPWTAAGKRIVLRVGTSPCGRRSSVPQWVRDAGACVLTHPETGEVFPVYWDRVFLDKWCAFVRAFGERYDKDPNVEFVQIAGVGWFGEMLLPRQTASGRFASLKDEWFEAGYSRAIYLKTYKRVLDTYLEAFPSKPIAIMLGYPMDDGTISEEIAEYAIGRYASRVYLQNNSLGAINGRTKKTDLAGWPHWASGYAAIYKKHRANTRIVLEMIYSVTSGNSPWGQTGSLADAVDVALKHQADYLFIWKEDIANPDPDVQRILDHAASKIGAERTADRSARKLCFSADGAGRGWGRLRIIDVSP